MVITDPMTGHCRLLVVHRHFSGHTTEPFKRPAETRRCARRPSAVRPRRGTGGNSRVCSPRANPTRYRAIDFRRRTALRRTISHSSSVDGSSLSLPGRKLFLQTGRAIYVSYNGRKKVDIVWPRLNNRAQFIQAILGSGSLRLLEYTKFTETFILSPTTVKDKRYSSRKPMFVSLRRRCYRPREVVRQPGFRTTSNILPTRSTSTLVGWVCILEPSTDEFTNSSHSKWGKVY